MVFGKLQTEISPHLPIAIWDNAPPGITDSLTLPDLGIAQKIIVSIDLNNSNIQGLVITLTDPASNAYTLYNRSGTGTQLIASYPDPVPTVSGDLNTWIGANPQGTWTIKVVDLLYLNNITDGQINSWGLTILTEAGDTVQIWNGNLLVSGKLGIGTTNPQSALQVEGYVQLDTLTAAPPTADCDETSERGRLKVDIANNLLYICMNSGWVAK